MPSDRPIALGLLLLILGGFSAPARASASSTRSDSLAAAASDTLSYTLEPLVVYGTPFALTTETAPFAVSTLTRSDAELSDNPGLSLEDLTYALPGVWVNERTHYALGDRITMRGLGWRAQFGVRGVQVLMDGIPLTMADGQSVVSIVDPAFIRTVEVIRGPASTFWGNGSGGVLYLSTRPTAGDLHTVRARQTLGSYGLSKTDLQVSPNLGPHTFTAFGSYLSQDGYRRHSTVRFGRFGFTGDVHLASDRGVRIMGAYSTKPEAESPGSLDRTAMTTDPTQAREAFVRYDAGESTSQGQIGATYYDALSIGRLQATAYGIFRDVENPLNFAYITVDRRAGGVRATLENDWQSVQWGLGVAGNVQRDDRVEYGYTTNDNGEPVPGETTVDQLEAVYNQAVFGRAGLPVGRLRLSAGLRYDWIRFQADIRRPGGESPQRTFQALSPSVGFTVDWPAIRLYANASTGLESPTASELSNRPGGGGGFNPALGPAHTLSLETGLQGLGPLPRLSYDVAAFAMQVRDLLMPFEDEDGETFYRNEGRTRHLGFEAALQWSLPRDLRLAASYTFNHSRFVDAEAQDVDLDGNEVPGVPPHLLGGRLRWQPDEAPWVTIEWRGASTYFVDSENTAESDGYVAVNARLSYPDLRLAPRASIQPFVAVNNVFDARYAAAVVVNGFGGRYYEPAPGRHWQAGLALQFD